LPPHDNPTHHSTPHPPPASPIAPPYPTGFAVAIDGPAGVGKSTTARKVAETLGMTYIDSGAMYRAIALYNITKGVNLKDEAAVATTLPNIEVSLSKQQVFLNGEDVSGAIRTQAISDATSQIASYAPVREKLDCIQKTQAATGQVIMDGRDIGSNVLPWAQVKIYLDADVDTRAARRVKDLTEKGQPADLAQIRNEIKERDMRDKNRKHGPLAVAKDAIVIDTSHMSQEEVAASIIAHINTARRKQCSIDSPEG